MKARLSNDPGKYLKNSFIISRGKRKYQETGITNLDYPDPMPEQRGYVSTFDATKTDTIIVPFRCFNKVLLTREASNIISYFVNNFGLFDQIGNNYYIEGHKEKLVKYKDVASCRFLYSISENKFLSREDIGNAPAQDDIVFGAEAIYQILKRFTNKDFFMNAILIELDNRGIEATTEKIEGSVEILPGFFVVDVSRVEEYRRIIADVMTMRESKLKILFELLKVDNGLNKLFQQKIYTLSRLLRPSLPSKGGLLEDKITSLYTKLQTQIANAEMALNVQSSYNTLIQHYNRIQGTVDMIQVGEDSSDPGYRCLAERIGHKEGLIRDDIIGCRIDYSARLVIAVDPTLPIGTVGIPFTAIYPLIESLAIKKCLHDKDRLEKILSDDVNEQRAIAEEIMKDKFIIIGRQPTLYYLGMQARRVRIIDGFVITVSPLDTPPFNADFDGDQMHIQMPITEKGQEDVRRMYEYRYRYPKDGKLTISLRQEILYGLHEYIEKGLSFNKYTESRNILKVLDLDIDDLFNKDPKQYVAELLRINSSEVSSSESFLNKAVERLYENSTDQEFIDAITTLVKIGFLFARIYTPNILINSTDIHKENPLENLDDIELLYKAKLISTDSYISSSTSRINKKLEFSITKEIQEKSNDWNNIISSKAKGSKSNLMQIMAIKGLINVDGSNIPNVVLSNISDGLSVSELFLAAHGSRKGLIDKTLGPAKPGELSRYLSYAASEIYIKSDKCDTEETLIIDDDILQELYNIKNVKDDAEYLRRKEMLFKTIMEAFVGRNSKDGKILSTNISEYVNKLMEGQPVRVYSPIFCDDKTCARCYGNDIRKANKKETPRGTNVGYIASQALSEPGTQLVMKKFQKGGIKSSDSSIDNQFDNLISIYKLEKDSKFFVNGLISKYGIEKSLSILALSIWKIYNDNEVKVNIKHIEVILAAMLRYIDVNDNVGRTFLTKNKQKNMIPVLLGVEKAILSDSNSFYKTSLEDFTHCIFPAILEDEAYGEGESRKLINMAFGKW